METQTLNDICDYRKGKTSVAELTLKNYISTENLMPNKGGLVEASGLPSTDTTQVYLTDDVLVSNIRPYFKKIWLAKEDGGCSNDVLVFAAKPGVDPVFLYYVLANDKFFEYSTASSKGTKMPRGDKGAIMQYEVPKLSLDDQKKIGQMLKCIDEKIECNNQINRNLSEQAQALFQSWFVDFEPFGGCRPDDWKDGILDEIIDFSNGYAFKGKELLDAPDPERECYDVFKQGHINRGGGFNITGTKSWYPKEMAKGLDKFVLRKGDVLMAMTDMKDNVAILGNTAVMELDGKYIVNQRVGLLRPTGIYGIQYPYISLLTNSHDFLKDLRSRANSGVQVNLSSNEIRNSAIIIAPENVNKEFNELVMPLFETMIENDLENQKLSDLRDTLLPKLMSGELDVSDLEI